MLGVSFVAAFVGTGCDQIAPTVVEADLVSDTDNADGPYEVRAVFKDPAKVERATLIYQPVSETRGIAQQRPMTRTDEPGDIVTRTPESGERWSGEIAGQPLGTVVRWGLEVCDRAGNCRLWPEGFPTLAFEFRVGRIPSSPEIDDVTPDLGPSSGGTRVEIRGSDFRFGARAFFAGGPAASVEWVREDLLVAITAPEDPGVVDVVVQNPDGIIAVAREAYTFIPSPILDRIDPAFGPSAGGTFVELTGSNFSDGMRAFVDDVPCRNQTLTSPTSLTCVTPPGRPGLVDVRVEHPANGFSVLEEGFRYVPPPVVDAVEPDRGPDQGGTVILISGEDFQPGAQVTVDGVACLEVNVIDEETISCVTPPGAPGVADVVVTNPDGQSSTLVGGFNYLGPPVIVQVVPGLGPHAGGSEVRLLGAGFSDNMDVRFGGVAAEIVDVIDDIELVVTLPPAPFPLVPAPDSGLRSVAVQVTNLDPNDGRSDVLEDAFQYFWPPEVFVVEPGAGPTAGGTSVTIRGRFFRNVPDGEFFVTFGEAAAAAFTVQSTEVISAVTPPGPAGFVDVSVENHPVSRGILVDGFEYIPPPVIERVEPDSGPTFGGEQVRIIGQNFRAGATVTFDGAPCLNVVFVNSTELVCTTPPGEEGFADVRVENPDGQFDVGDNLYEYLGVVVAPDFGMPVGFTRVRILAAGVQEGATVRFGNVIASNCDVLNNREILCQTPPSNDVGFVDVSFTNPDGTGDDAQDAFEYREFIDVTVEQISNRSSASANYPYAEDFDRDGDIDIIVGNGSPGVGGQQDEIYENTGSGFFQRTPLSNDTFVTNKVTHADIDGDELVDIVIAVSDDGGARVYRNLGNLEFELFDAPQFGVGSFDAQMVDIIGGAAPDLLILTIGCSPDGQNILDCTDFSIGVDGLFEQTSFGNFAERPGLIPHELDLTHDHKFVATDLDLDGDKDLVINVDTVNFAVPEFDDNFHRVLYNRTDEGLGFVEDRTPFANVVGDLYGIDEGDVDNDGFPDVVMPSCAPPFGPSELLFRNIGGALSIDNTAIQGVFGDCDVGVHLFDVDRDGDLDAAFVGNRQGILNIKVFVNRGDGTFVNASAFVEFPDISVNATGVRSGDFDGDGDLDLVVASTALGLPTGDLRILFLD